MPIREYEAAHPEASCPHCLNGFEQLEQIGGTPMITCPRCRNPVRLLFSAPRVGRSASALDDRAKNAGFHKLKKIGTGEYEKQY